MPDILILGVETSGILCSVAWWQQGKTLLEYNIEMKHAHSTILADMIKRGHKELAIDTRSVTHIAVGTGPGSFTGLRIGMSFAKGFCMGKNISLLPVTNFEILAAFADETYQPLYTLIEARHEMYYAGVFSHKKGELTNKYIADKNEIVSEIPAAAQIVIHEEIQKGAFQKILPSDRVVIQGEYRSSIICEIGQRILMKQQVPPLDDVEPLYLQAFAGVL